MAAARRGLRLLLAALLVATAAAGASAMPTYFSQTVYLSGDCGSALWYTSTFLLDYCFRSDASSSYFTFNGTTVTAHSCRTDDCSADCGTSSTLPIIACYFVPGVSVSYTFSLIDAPQVPAVDAVVQTVFGEPSCANEIAPTAEQAFTTGCAVMSTTESYLTETNGTHFTMWACTDGACLAGCLQDWVEPLDDCQVEPFNTSIQITLSTPEDARRPSLRRRRLPPFLADPNQLVAPPAVNEDDLASAVLTAPFRMPARLRTSRWSRPHAL